MIRPSNLTQLLEENGSLDNTGITFIEGSSQEAFLSYKEVYHAAKRALAGLQEKGIGPKEELVFQVSDNKTFIILYWACILGGIIPVPLSVGLNEAHKLKLFNIWPYLNSPWVVASNDYLTNLAGFAHEHGLHDRFVTISQKAIDPQLLLLGNSEGIVYQATGNDIAFVQFSSGSTGSPKGVTITHQNLLTNMLAIGKAACYSSSDVMMSWMPLTHDMGLIGFHINPLYYGMDQYLIPTQLFTRRPAIWMDKISEHKASIICSPNFGYRYFLKHWDTSRNYDWDLSAVRIVYNGAEPISATLYTEFMDKLSCYGLKKNAMCPVYGLAEATLAVSVSGLQDEVISINVSRGSLGIGDHVDECENHGQGVSFVNVGRPVQDCQVRITGHDHSDAGNGTVGFINIKGNNVTRGYYNNQPETDKILTDGWLNTGDIGFMREDGLYVVGRAKDIIFVNGQNYYSHDIERIAEQVEGVELNKIVVVGHVDEETQKEEIIAFILFKEEPGQFLVLAEKVRETVNIQAGIEINRTIPVRDIPKTTSGKLQRYKLLEQFKKGMYRVIEEKLVTGLAIAERKSMEEPDETERLIWRIWKKVFNNEQLGWHESFLAAGGNSLKAAEISMLLQQELEVDVAPGILFEKQTIKELAVAIRTAGKTAMLPVAIAPVQEYYPLSVVQKRLYYAWQIAATSTTYNVPVACRLDGPVDVSKLEAAIRSLVYRHDTLRMSFHMHDEPVFRVQEEVNIVWYYTSCRDTELNDTLQALIRPFNISGAGLFSASLVQVNNSYHILLLDFHHLIADGLSVQYFLRELFSVYDGSQLPPVTCQYKDYVAWEKQWHQSEKVQQCKEYWLKQLQHDLPKLEMPVDNPRAVVFNTSGHKLFFNIDEATTARLRHLAQTNNCTLHVLLLTVYNLLLSKYTGQEDIVVGIPVAGRRQLVFQHMQGMFVNNLAIRSTIEGDQFFTALLKQAKKLVASALQNQDYPFDQLIGDLAIKRDVSRNPVFDTMFTYHTVALPQPATPGLNISRYNFDPGIAKFDLSMEMFEEENALQCGIEYATGLFNQLTIEHFGKHFTILINRILANPHGRVKDYLVMDEEEYTAQVIDFNTTECNYPYDKTIHELFEEQVNRSPAHIALVYGVQQMTYKELDERASKIAGHLRKKGVVPNTIVGLLLKRSPELIISILAVLKAGGCYLPIDTNMPAKRINLLMADSRCRLIISNRESIGDYRPEHTDCPWVLLLDREEQCFTDDTVWPFISTPNNLAYIIYTSGTTGTPKGVMISHRSLVNYIWWAAEKYIQNETLAFPLFTSISFDLTVTSVFAPLLTGNTIVVYDDSDKEVLIEKIIADNSVEVIKLTPSHLKIIAAGFLPVTGSKIKRFIVGGEQLEARVAKQVYEKFLGQVEIYNEYGPTEATVGCMIYKYNPADNQVNVPVGVPAHNTKIYILDKHLHPVPVGVKGEIYIAGDGLAKGYLFNQGLTQQKFIPDLFNEGKKMYKTGDTARRLPGNIIEYTGRYDEQVKINGFRIELPEIVHHLAQVPGIAEAVVAVKTNIHNRKNLYAWYTAASSNLPDGPEINNRLALVLPHYMLPVRYIHIESIPLTKNGKINYDVLPLPDNDIATEKNTGALGATTLLMLRVWEEVLNEKTITVADNFFELGGDSIKAVQIVARLLDQGISISVKDILTYHTIRQISRHAILTDHCTRYNQGIAEGMKKLTPIEKWFLGNHFVNPAYYNQSILIAFNKEINLALLQQAFKIIIEHHDGLRLNYDPVQEAMFYNNSHLHQDFNIPVYTGLSQEAEIQLLQECRNFLDLNGRLLLRTLMLKDKSPFGSLFITMHHLVTDGISWRILLEDLYAAYSALEAGRLASLPPKTASLFEWVNRLPHWTASATFELEKDYWKKIDNYTDTIPVDEETSDWRVATSKRMSGSLDTDLTLFLTREANDIYKTNVPVLLNTALALTLKEWTGLSECVIEQEGHGREEADIEISRTVGWFTALYPVHLRLNETGIGAQIREIKEQMKKIPRGGVGYGWCRYEPHSTHNHTERAPIRFNYLGQFGRELNNDIFSFAGNPAGFESDPANRMTAKIECNLMITNGRLLIDIYYNAKAHKESTIQWLLHTFLANLNTILDHLKNEKDIYFTPSDFDCVNLDQEELDALF